MQKSDRAFMLSLSPSLARGAKLAWHKEDTVQKFQDSYILDMLAETAVQNITLIAEENSLALGFIHTRKHTDEMSGEVCGTVPLLAVAETAQGRGVGKLLMEAAEDWTKTQGWRLLHLEVFAANGPAQGFYQKLGFVPETIHMIKPLD